MLRNSPLLHPVLRLTLAALGTPLLPLLKRAVASKDVVVAYDA
jgi:hypothetical protein